MEAGGFSRGLFNRRRKFRIETVTLASECGDAKRFVVRSGRNCTGRRPGCLAPRLLAIQHQHRLSAAPKLERERYAYNSAGHDDSVVPLHGAILSIIRAE